MPSHLPIARLPAWEAIPRLTHGFCGRQGGVSQGAFAELNLSLTVGDQPACVRENWRRLEAAVAGVRFLGMQQRHGATIAQIDGTTAVRPEADALITRAAGVALCILTADCVPILLVAPRQGVVAAVHAGWRGTLLGIVPAAVAHMHKAFGAEPGDLHATLGPAIGGCCYEVERRITDELEQRWGTLSEAIVNGAAKSQLDLRRANAAILAASGVPPTQIACVGPCTRCAGADYFSYRGAGGHTGRQLSFIGWRV